jgi:hypothetical protein
MDDSPAMIAGNVSSYDKNQAPSHKVIENKQHFETKPTQSDQISHVYDTLAPELDDQESVTQQSVTKRKPAIISFTKKRRAKAAFPVDTAEKKKINVSKTKGRGGAKSKSQSPGPKIIKPSIKNFNQSVMKTPDGQLMWDHQDSHAQHLYNIRYGIVPARLIYNLASPELVVKPSEWNNRIDKQWVASVYVNRFNEEVGFYDKLEKSIVEEGIRNPILVTAGSPRWRGLEEVDLEYRQNLSSSEWLFCEFLGGSRLYLAQKNNWLMPVIISDWTSKYSHFKQIHTREELATCFVDPPNHMYFTTRGLRTTPPPHVHLDPLHQDPRLLSEIRRNILSEDLKNV